MVLPKGRRNGDACVPARIDSCHKRSIISIMKLHFHSLVDGLSGQLRQRPQDLRSAGPNPCIPYTVYMPRSRLVWRPEYDLYLVKSTTMMMVACIGRVRPGIQPVPALPEFAPARKVEETLNVGSFQRAPRRDTTTTLIHLDPPISS